MENIHTEDSIKYCKWVSRKEQRQNEKTKKMITVQLTKKEIYSCPISEILILFKIELESILKHEYNIYHQYNVVENLKDNLKDDDCFVLIDFSENYSCKYGSEVQSVHFGATKQQLTIHTGVIWTTSFTQGFATISKSLRHDSAAVMAHLLDIFYYYLPQLDYVKTLHFMSDGPTTQYKNRTMFYLIIHLLPKYYSQIERITYNFSESGHGKGPADGIGAAIKRICDDKVSYGQDISDLNAFLLAVKEHSKKIHVASGKLNRTFHV